MRIVWSDVAEADLDELYDYIARDVPFYAGQFIDRLIDAVGVLQDHPQLGRHVPEKTARMCANSSSRATASSISSKPVRFPS